MKLLLISLLLLCHYAYPLKPSISQRNKYPAEKGCKPDIFYTIRDLSGCYVYPSQGCNYDFQERFADVCLLNGLNGAPPDSVIYKTTPQGNLKMYFHYPPNWKPEGNYPAMVFFFGGGFRSGNINQFKTQAEYFAGRGMVVARADYRVLERHGTTPDKCVEDGKSAVRWIRSHAGELGIDPEKIVTSGGSAGGNIAACTFSVPGLEAEGEDMTISSKPNLLVLYNPVMKTTGNGIVERLKSKELAFKISPNDHLTSDLPPLIMFFGTEDRLIEYAYETLQIAKDLGFHAELWTADGQKHGFFNSNPWQELTIFLTDKFLINHGYLEKEPVIEVADSVEMQLFILND